MLFLVQVLCTAIIVALLAGSLLNLSTSPHWFVRGWDFPRVQIIFIAVVCMAIYVGCSLVAATGFTRWDWTVLVISACLVVWHLIRIVPYTAIAPVQSIPSKSSGADRSLRIVVSNVQQDNKQYDLWIDTVKREQPDVLIVLEVDQVWMEKLEGLRGEFADEISYPQDNCYGILMLSRRPIVESEVRFLVEDDVPSIDSKIELKSGQLVRVIAVHPRPPEPIRDIDSTSRDAELLILGQELSEETLPVVMGGDLNDVAWSGTTRLFLRISHLLDPRRGRGFFNSFHAKHWWMRFPLDHLFHSDHFTLRRLGRLDAVGSDHFPMLIELQCEPHEGEKQQSLDADKDDHQHAEELVRRAAI